MVQFIKSRWLLLFSVLAFVILKWPALHYAFFWDESWPYAGAVFQMCKDGISLLPNALDPELSRGHPLLFHVLAACWIHIFGASHIAVHSFALCISVVLLVTIFEISNRLFNKRVALLSLWLVMAQVAFFVQSTFLLLEIFLSLLIIITLYSYMNRNYISTALFLTCAFFTKESSFVLGIVLFFDFCLTAFKPIPARQKFLQFLSIAVPGFLIASFFVVQKYYQGWYFFPLHIQIMEHSWQMFWYKLRMSSIHAILYDNQKVFYYLLMLLFAVLVAIKTRRSFYLTIFLPAFCIYYFVDDMRAGRLLPSIPFFVLFLVTIILFVYSYIKFEFIENKQGRFIGLSVAFIVAFLCFSSFNFFTFRYIFPALFMLLMVAAALLESLCTRINKYAFPGVIVLITVTAYVSFKTDTGWGDCSLGAFKAMELQQEAVDFFEHSNYYQKRIYSQSSLQRIHLLKKESGFLRGDQVFTNVSTDAGSAEYLIFDNIESVDSLGLSIREDNRFRLVHSRQTSGMWLTIYKRK